MNLVEIWTRHYAWASKVTYKLKLKVNLAFCFGPKPKFFIVDLDLDQAEQNCNVTKYTSECVTIMPRHCNITKNTLISVTLDAQEIVPGQDRNKNHCVFCNIVLTRVTLSPTGSPAPGPHSVAWLEDGSSWQPREETKKRLNLSPMVYMKQD